MKCENIRVGTVLIRSGVVLRSDVRVRPLMHNPNSGMVVCCRNIPGHVYNIALPGISLNKPKTHHKSKQCVVTLYRGDIKGHSR